MKENNAEFRYREYTKDPLSETEIRTVLKQLGMSPRQILRKADAKKNNIADTLDDDGLIAAMAVHPRLIQRPIGVLDDHAELGRPVGNLLRLVG